MRFLYFFVICMTTLLCNKSYAQCEKDIATNPISPLNNEFLPLKNEWYPNSINNPIPYTENSFLNTHMNWSPGSSITLDLNAGWEHNFGNAGNYNMRNPFANNHDDNHLNSGLAPGDELFRDWHWQDGWELLWINTGFYPNGDPYDDPSSGTYYATGNAPNNPSNPEILDAISPSNVPYFVLYNRYTGMVRLFANVWQNSLTSSFQEWGITMKYTGFDLSNERVSGLFRHASPYDIPLDQPSETFQLLGPRVQAINSSDWVVAEFQMAFDPCICMREFDGVETPGRIQFLFETIETVDIDLLSRTLETESAITETNLNEDFLNLSILDANEYNPGSVMYQRMDDMFTKYQTQLEAYNDEMNDFNEGWNNAKWDLLDLSKNFVKSGLNLAIPGGGIFKEVLKAEGIFDDGSEDGSKITNKAIKGLVGAGVDYGSFELFGKKPNKPVKPSPPVASFSETSYKGKLIRSFYQETTPLFIPGGISQAFDPSTIDPNLSAGEVLHGYGRTQLYPSTFPAYNKVLGVSALLRKPEFEIFYQSSGFEFEEVYNDYNEVITWPPNPNFEPHHCTIIKQISSESNFRLRAIDLQVALNRTLDFDMTKTNTYVRIEVTLENSISEPEDWNHNEGKDYTFEYNSENNFHLEHEFTKATGGRQREFASRWIPLSKLNQYVYSLSITDIAEWRSEPDLFEGECVTSYTYPFDASTIESEVTKIQLKILQDNYFDQIGFFDEQINTTQITTVKVYDPKKSINYLIDPIQWEFEPIENFNAYSPGNLILENEVISESHPLVQEVQGNQLFMRAEEITIIGDITVAPKYILVLEALSKIHMDIASSYNPQIKMSIRDDFYSTPVFDYIDNSQVYDFCNASNEYQANSVASAIMAQLQDEFVETEEVKTNYLRNSVSLFPNPARDLLTLRSSHLDMTSITIHDLSGRPIKQQTLQANFREMQINLSGIAPGTYIVRIDCGDEVFSEKLVVTR
ncbi:MAG: hypothetical protein ACJAQ4_001499 [Cryomorphaceae bacterium]|jgi:hypothetical protein